MIDSKDYEKVITLMKNRGYTLMYKGKTFNGKLESCVFGSQNMNEEISITVEVRFNSPDDQDLQFSYVTPTMNTLSSGWSSCFFLDKRFNLFESQMKREAQAIQDIY